MKPASYPEVQPLRQAARQIVRELGFLEESLSNIGVTHSECHALIELEHHGVLTQGELADILNLDKSTMSRTISGLLDTEQVATKEDGDDKRKKPLMLTSRGRRRLARIHEYATAQVQSALSLLDENERRVVVQGLDLYARALTRLRAQAEFRIRRIETRDDPEVARIIRTVMPEFRAGGPGFAIHDAEVSDMHRAYTGERSGYFVLSRGGDRIVGGGGFGHLQAGSAEVCELRKMYLLPDARGFGMGKRLLQHILDAARESGYKTCYLETLESMTQARRLYENCGFQRLSKPMGRTGHFGCNAWYSLKLTTR